MPGGPKPAADAARKATVTEIDLRSPSAVCRALRLGAEANRDARCRCGSIDRIDAPGWLVATGDLHDNPDHYARVVALAGLGIDADQQPSDATGARPEPKPPGDGATGFEGTPAERAPEPAHLTLHELIHSDRLIGGMDFSYRALTRVALLKSEHPELVHTLLANHELAQVLGSGIVKDGVLVVEAFDQGVEYVFGSEAEGVREAIGEFIRSMPLALRCRTPRGDILCSHSLPGPAMMQRFDPSILDRELREEDYEPRRGSAHLMVWGRGYDAEQLEDLVERWGVNVFILGHEHVDAGVMLVEPNAVVLNSDHERGVCLPMDLSDPPSAQEMPFRVVPLSRGS